MGECPISFRHPVGVFPLFHSCSLLLRSVEQFIGDFNGYFLAFFGTRRFNYPAHSQSRSPIPNHLNRNLIVGSPNSAGFKLNKRRNVFDGLLKDIKPSFFSSFMNDVKSVINDFFSNTPLPLSTKCPTNLPIRRLPYFESGFQFLR